MELIGIAQRRVHRAVGVDLDRHLAAGQLERLPHATEQAGQIHGFALGEARAGVSQEIPHDAAEAFRFLLDDLQHVLPLIVRCGGPHRLRRAANRGHRVADLVRQPGRQFTDVGERLLAPRDLQRFDPVEGRGRLVRHHHEIAGQLRGQAFFGHLTAQRDPAAHPLAQVERGHEPEVEPDEFRQRPADARARDDAGILPLLFQVAARERQALLLQHARQHVVAMERCRVDFREIAAPEQQVEMVLVGPPQVHVDADAHRQGLPVFFDRGPDVFRSHGLRQFSAYLHQSAAQRIGRSQQRPRSAEHGPAERNGQRQDRQRRQEQRDEATAHVLDQPQENQSHDRGAGEQDDDPAEDHVDVEESIPHQDHADDEQEEQDRQGSELRDGKQPTWDEVGHPPDHRDHGTSQDVKQGAFFGSGGSRKGVPAEHPESREQDPAEDDERDVRPVPAQTRERGPRNDPRQRGQRVGRDEVAPAAGPGRSGQRQDELQAQGSGGAGAEQVHRTPKRVLVAAEVGKVPQRQRRAEQREQTVARAARAANQDAAAHGQGTESGDQVHHQTEVHRNP